MIPAVYSGDPLKQAETAYDTSLQAERAYVGCEGLALIEEGDITMMLMQLGRYINSTYIEDMLDLGPTDLECLSILKRILPDSVKNTPTAETIQSQIEGNDGE